MVFSRTYKIYLLFACWMFVNQCWCPGTPRANTSRQQQLPHALQRNPLAEARLVPLQPVVHHTGNPMDRLSQPIQLSDGRPLRNIKLKEWLRLRARQVPPSIQNSVPGLIPVNNQRLDPMLSRPQPREGQISSGTILAGLPTPRSRNNAPLPLERRINLPQHAAPTFQSREAGFLAYLNALNIPHIPAELVAPRSGPVQLSRLQPMQPLAEPSQNPSDQSFYWWPLQQGNFNAGPTNIGVRQAPQTGKAVLQTPQLGIQPQIGQPLSPVSLASP